MEQKSDRKQYRLILIPVMAAMLLLGMCMTAWAADVEYPLRVGGEQVTPGHMRGDGWSFSPTNTLTLKGFDYTGCEAGIDYTGQGELKIVLEGSNSIRCANTNPSVATTGIISSGMIDFSGSGSLEVECTKEGPSIAIFALSNDITIESGTVTAKASLFGIVSLTDRNASLEGGIASLEDGNASLEGGNVIINGGTVNAKGIFGFWGNMVEINGGTVTATGENIVYGIGGNEITISGNKTSVTAAGTQAAIYGNVKNLIDGVGWTNTAGTAGRTDIAINAGGRELENYKKVRFPKILGPAAVTRNPAAKSLTYTGSAQALVTDGTASGGTILYALGTSAVNAPTTGWSTSIPARTEAGIYHVWYMVKGDEDHSDTKPVHIEVTIGAAPVPPDSPTAESAYIAMNSSFRLSWRGRKVKAAWGSAPGADSYEVWAAYCGTSTFEKVCTVQGKNKASIKRLKGKQLSRKRCVKAYVVAMRAGTEIGRTFIGHTAGPENWHTNAKKVSISKRAYNLSVGQTDKIQAKIVKVKKGHKLLHGKALVYASSNPAVAAVSSDGQISAVGAGNCDVWVYALNGKHQKLTVTVQ